MSKKKVLFISVNFFGYHEDIVKKMKTLDMSVDYFDERPANNFFTKFLIRINKQFLFNKINRYYDSILNQTKSNNYDYILIIKGEVVSPKFLRKVKELHPNAKLILYLYDPIQNNANVITIYKEFDTVYTFEKKDTLKYNLKFLPLFYVDQFQDIKPINKGNFNKILFLGTIHSDRLEFLMKINHQLKSLGYSFTMLMFIQSKLIFYFKKITVSSFFKMKKSDFFFKSLNKTQIARLIDDHAIIIDIQHPNQQGLTMRTIETIGARRKLITTNSDILNYDFYSSQNILIVDRKNPCIDKSFFNEPYELVEDSILEKYSLESWVKNVLSLN